MTEREKALQEFKYFKEMGYGHADLPSSGSIELAIAALQSPRDWTPCAEGMPTVKETVLATIADGFGNDIMFAWYDGENWKDGYKNKIPVIAWQPLPEPWRGDTAKDHIVDANKKVEDADNGN